MDKMIYILYFSRTGNTLAIAKRIFYIFNEFDPRHIKMELIPIEKADYEKLKEGAALIIGTPDYFNYPAGKIKTFFDDIYDDIKFWSEKPVFCFCSHDGGGKAIKYLEELCKSLKFKIIGPSIVVKKDEISSKHENQIKKNIQTLLKHLRED